MTGLLILIAAVFTGFGCYHLTCAFVDVPTAKTSRMMMLARKQTGTGEEKLFDVYLTKIAVLHNKLSGLEVLPVDCNSVEIQSVFHNPLVELAVYRHPCHHQKTGQPHPSGISA